MRVEQADDGTTELRAVEWHSSADVVVLTTAQGLMVIPPNEQVRTGDLVRYRPMA